MERRSIRPKRIIRWCAAIIATLDMAATTAWADPLPVTSQGWDAAQQNQFYKLDQGSRLMPLNWLNAFKQPDDPTHQKPFLTDSMARYGYLPNPGSPAANLPVGFSVTNDTKAVVGMTCAACHTRDIRVNGQSTRIDGGPAFTDFFKFMTDLDSAASYAGGAGWPNFCADVLGLECKNKAKAANLKKNFQTWQTRLHAIVSGALNGPNVQGPEWGLARLDAVQMIYNRLTGLDLGPSKANYIIQENIKPAIAPARYPFLWNAGRQTKTQWPGFGDQTTEVLGIHVGILGRNVGEVIGVFGDINPTKAFLLPLSGVNYLNNNTVDFGNLTKLESLVDVLSPPPFPASVNKDKAANGYKVYMQECLQCHALPSGNATASWPTPIQNVGTDASEWNHLTTTANPGALTGTAFPRWEKPKLENGSLSFSILTQTVTGSILQHEIAPWLSSQPKASSKLKSKAQSNATASAPATGLAHTPAHLAHQPELKADQDAVKSLPFKGDDIGTLNAIMVDPKTGLFCDSGYSGPCYEARVLKGIWAAAPYLHNASVPTMWDLLMPAKNRPATFAVGADYDVINMGVAKSQTGLNSSYVTTGCDKSASGNSNCGHEFGVNLSDSDKWDLIEYLKTL